MDREASAGMRMKIDRDRLIRRRWYQRDLLGADGATLQLKDVFICGDDGQSRWTPQTVGADTPSTEQNEILFAPNGDSDSPRWLRVYVLVRVHTATCDKRCTQL
jgi:hypothetical protein